MGNYKLIEVKLTPITPYFFGKEPFHLLGNKSDYFQTSLDIPQQTTLLGLLRHKILRDNGIDLNQLDPKNENNLDPKVLIGERSFQVNNNTFNQFGKIHSISPCYIVSNAGERLFFENSEHIDGKSITLKVDEENNIILYYGGKPYLSKKFFDEKIGCINKNEILHGNAKVGIYKGGVKTVSTSKSYFIMECKNLGTKDFIDKERQFSKFKKWSFGFLALVAGDLGINVLDDIMPMGKEQSLFKVKTKVLNENVKLEENKVYIYNVEKEYSLDGDILKCVLLSDAKVSQEDLKGLQAICLLQVTNKQRVRYIKRNTQNYHLGEKPTKENKAFNLISKGSVLFFETSKKDDIIKILDKAQDFKQIGYNYYYFKNAK